MSHFTHMEMKLGDKGIVEQLCRARGWTVQKEDQYKDRFNNSMENGHVVRDSSGNVKLLIDHNDKVIVDPYYMGHDYQKFLQDYGAEHITQKAMLAGACTTNQGLDAHGNLVLEVAY